MRTCVHICACVLARTRARALHTHIHVCGSVSFGSVGPASSRSRAPLRAVPLLAGWAELLAFLLTSKYKRTTGTNKPLARSSRASPSCRSAHNKTDLWNINVLETRLALDIRRQIVWICVFSNNDDAALRLTVGSAPQVRTDTSDISGHSVPPGSDSRNGADGSGRPISDMKARRS